MDSYEELIRDAVECNSRHEREVDVLKMGRHRGHSDHSRILSRASRWAPIIVQVNMRPVEAD